MTPIVLEYDDGSPQQRSFDVVLREDRENDVVKRTAVDGTDESLLLGYYRMFDIDFKYLSDTDLTYLRAFFGYANKRIELDTTGDGTPDTWYEVEFENPKKMGFKEKAGYSMTLKSKTRY